MSKLKFTQGEWKTDPYDGSLTFGGQIIAEPRNFKPDSAPIEEGKANCRLAAAAPKLLEALKTARIQIIELLNEGDFRRHIEIDLGYIVDTIAKAEGSEDEGPIRKGSIMRYELINPSDEIHLESDCEKSAIIAALFVGDGYYGLRDDHGNLILPVVAFSGAEPMVKEKFGSVAAYQKFVVENRKKIAQVMLTFKCARERSSMNDICGRAHRIGNRALEAGEVDSA